MITSAIRPSALLTILLALAAPPATLGLGDPPAFPVPECRDASNGDEVPCSDPGAVRLWPPGFQPGLPGQALPEERDSTGWDALTVPGADSGYELFESLDVEAGHLFVAYNAGLQVWDLSGGRAEDPLRRAVADGWRGDFLSFPPIGENDFLTNDVAAAGPAGRGTAVLVAVAADAPVGVSIWRFTPPSTLAPLYQDAGNESEQVRVAQFDGTVYAFAAGAGGISVYDMSAAAALPTPCLDAGGTVCPGVYLGEVGTMTTGHYLDLVERGGNVYLAAANGGSSGLDLEIWEVSDPADPGGAALKFAGLDADTFGTALFELGGGYYLAAVEDDVNIYDAAACLDADGCASPGAPLASIARLPFINPQYLTYSESDGVPFLYYGIFANLQGTKIERLLDLTTLGGTNQITEITDGGGTYTDPVTLNPVDYWGDYYPGNAFGLPNVAPLVGRFEGRYFYRAAFGILDVHVRGGAIFSDGFESGDATAWTSQVP